MKLRYQQIENANETVGVKTNKGVKITRIMKSSSSNDIVQKGNGQSKSEKS